MMASDLDVHSKFIYLRCDLQLNQLRDQGRSSDNQMNDRVGIVRSELEEYEWPDFVQVIDSTALSIKETLDQILYL